MKVSISIICYEMNGRGSEFLEYSLQQIEKQTYKDYEVVVTDHSIDGLIESVCDKWKERIEVNYYRCEEKRGFFTANRNLGIRKSKGDIIKFLDQDDFLVDEYALEKIVENFDEETNWLVSAYIHTKDRKTFFKVQIPHLNDKIYLVNTIGSPTGLTIRNRDVVYLDENLRWIGDAEYYKSLLDKFGLPKILIDVTAVNFLWDGQTSNTIVDQELRRKENQYVIDKFEGGL